MNSRLPEERIVAFSQAELPNLIGVWLFGSQANGHADARSDVDLAILVAGRADPLPPADYRGRHSRPPR